MSSALWCVDERPRRGAAGDRMHHRRLDLEIAARDEELADRLHDAASASTKTSRGVRVGDQVDVALAVSLLLVGEAVELLRQRPQRLREQPERRDLDRQLAGARPEERPRCADDVAQVPVLERLVGLGADAVARHVELDAPAHVLDRREARLAHDALQHHPAGDGHADSRRLERLVRRRAVLRVQVRRERVAAEVVGERVVPSARSAASFARRSAMIWFSSTGAAGLMGALVSSMAIRSLR